MNDPEVQSRRASQPMHFIYPSSILEPRLPDDLFREETRAMRDDGHGIHLTDIDAPATDPRAIVPPLPSGSCVAYRGWMLTADRYRALAGAIEEAGARCMTSPEAYLATHHLPNWYPLVASHTPETILLDGEADPVRQLRALGWERMFIKDFVKSLKTSIGSIIEAPEEIARMMAEMESYRGFIEGGICVRRVEHFLPGSERRYFVREGVAYGADPDAPIPEAVLLCADRIPSPFFSVDIAIRDDGIERIVEMGDGQVSDLVGWRLDRFVEIWHDAGEERP